MEGGALFGLDQELNPASYNSDKQYCFDEATSCGPAFRVFKQLIQRCLSDAVTSGNVFADAVLQHLYRWLCRLLYMSFYSVCTWIFYLTPFANSYCSPKSKLHDPALHRMLHKVNSSPGYMKLVVKSEKKYHGACGQMLSLHIHSKESLCLLEKLSESIWLKSWHLASRDHGGPSHKKMLDKFYSLDTWYPYWQVMQKVFALLMAELRKLGATIVFATFGRVIIDTGKSDLSAAKAYCESVLKTLQTRFVSACILEDF